MSAAAQQGFLDQVISDEGMVQPERLSEVLRITKGELAHPQWAYAPESGVGAGANGGRFNPVGMAALSPRAGSKRLGWKRNRRSLSKLSR
jgi:RES domain-containing protein